MSGLSLLFLLGILFVGLRMVLSMHDVVERQRLRKEETGKWQQAIEHDPSNAGAHGNLAEIYVQDGKLAEGIHEYRVAINLLPRGPFSAKWKRHLKQALERQEAVERALAAGQKPPGYNDWLVCHGCDGTVSTRDKHCPRCGTIISMGFFEWAMKADTQADIWRTSLPIILVLWVALIIFMALPIEVKGTVIIVSAMVGFWLFRRSFDSYV